jgi:hypothetical protein
MILDVHFESTKEFPEIAKTPEVGETVWVNYYPAHGSEEYMAIPLTCTKVYQDGSWDGYLEEGEA